MLLVLRRADPNTLVGCKHSSSKGFSLLQWEDTLVLYQDAMEGGMISQFLILEPSNNSFVDVSDILVFFSARGGGVRGTGRRGWSVFVFF